jgi:hypothetical protein
MTSSTKQKVLILLGLVMLVTLLIAASLPQLELQPGMPLPKLEVGQIIVAEREAEPLVTVSVSKFLLIFFGLILGGSMLYVLYQLFKGADWKFLTSFIPSMVVISLSAVSFIFFILLLTRSGKSSPPMDIPIPTATPPVTSPLGPVPPILIWIVGIGLLLTGIWLGVWSFISASRKPTAMDTVGFEAEKAWQALTTGLDLKDVIVKCYQQMSAALEKEQGVERDDFMTTREFESLLEAAGVPHDPIHQLTRLFEAVRYGHWQPNPLDEEKAIRCLEAIMLYSREAKKEAVK